MQRWLRVAAPSFVACLLAATLLSAAPRAAAAEPCVPWQEAFAEDLDDPPRKPPSRHWYASNERFIHLFLPYIEDLGGVYVGLGTDQNYVMIGRMKPQVAVLLDRDIIVKRLHHVYLAFFRTAKDPAAFLKLWSPRATKRAKRAIDEVYRDQPRVAHHAKKIYAEAQRRVGNRLQTLVRWGRKDPRKLSFVADEQQYQHIASMVRERRIIPVYGNLRGTHAMKAVARAAQRSGLPVRVFYISNAEGYFGDLPKALRENMLALPFDERSVMLRTRPGLPTTVTYFVEDGWHYHQWLVETQGPIERIFKRAHRVERQHEDTHRLGVIHWRPGDGEDPSKGPPHGARITCLKEGAQHGAD